MSSPLIEFAERVARELDDATLRRWLDEHTADDRSAYAELKRQLDGPGKVRTRATLVDVDNEVQHQIRW